MAITFSEFMQSFGVQVNQDQVNLIESLIDESLKDIGLVQKNNYVTPEGTRVFVVEVNCPHVDACTAKAIHDKYIQAGWMKVEITNKYANNDKTNPVMGRSNPYVEVKFHIVDRP